MIQAKLDTARFERDLALYVKETSKTVIDAVNYKLYDATREALKKTDKADRNTVKESLDAICENYPNRTVAEVLVIMQHERTGEEIADLTKEAKAFKGKRFSSIGFTKAGWLPALKELLRHVGRESVTIAGVVRVAFGGAQPARQEGGKVMGSSYNDVAGTGNKEHVETIKDKGAQAGIDKVSLDMETYLSKKLDIPIERFNNA